MNFKEKISIHYTSLTPTEKRICTMIFDNPQIIIKNSIVEAGVLCHTSKSAILRFAKKLEYRGYSEFKYAINEYYSSQKDYPKKINDNTLASQIILNFKKTVDQLANLNLDDKLKSKYSYDFEDKYYGREEEFKAFISESVFSVKGDYKETWNFIKANNNSLNRFSNFGLFFDRNLEE